MSYLTGAARLLAEALAAGSPVPLTQWHPAIGLLEDRGLVTPTPEGWVPHQPALRAALDHTPPLYCTRCVEETAPADLVEGLCPACLAEDRAPLVDRVPPQVSPPILLARLEADDAVLRTRGAWRALRHRLGAAPPDPAASQALYAAALARRRAIARRRALRTPAEVGARGQLGQ